MGYKDPAKAAAYQAEYRIRRRKVDAWAVCKVEGCDRRIKSNNTHGFCRSHKERKPRTEVRVRQKRKRKYEDRSEYRRQRYQADPAAEAKKVAEWRAANPEKAKQSSRETARRHRERKALADAAAARKNPKPHPAALRLLELAEARAVGANYGYSGTPNISHR